MRFPLRSFLAVAAALFAATASAKQTAKIGPTAAFAGWRHYSRLCHARQGKSVMSRRGGHGASTWAVSSRLPAVANLKMLPS